MMRSKVLRMDSVQRGMENEVCPVDVSKEEKCEDGAQESCDVFSISHTGVPQ
jgi:hypothetical protein